MLNPSSFSLDTYKRTFRAIITHKSNQAQKAGAGPKGLGRDLPICKVDNRGGSGGNGFRTQHCIISKCGSTLQLRPWAGKAPQTTCPPACSLFTGGKTHHGQEK